VDSNRETPGSASGVSQTGIYVGAAFGPAAFGALAHTSGYGTAWAAVAVMTLLSAGVLWLARRQTAAAALDSRHKSRIPGV
jgi:cyanate permease